MAAGRRRGRAGLAVDVAARIAETVLYEGYLLWPYRRSATKNRRRWSFGGVHPRGWEESGHPDDRSLMQTQCLLEGRRPVVEVRVRFLHVVRRTVARRVGEGLEAVDELSVAGERHLSWDEAAEREVGVTRLRTDGRGDVRAGAAISVPAGEAVEPLVGAAGEPVGAIVRSWRELRGEVEVTGERLSASLWRLTVRVVNTTPWEPSDREDALRGTFCSTHTLLQAAGGAFVSMTDPPPAHRAAADACRNIGTWPVLVGDDADRRTLLSSPIVLPDRPQIAPESPGDLFDGTEIDGLLILNVLGLTDAEREEMRATDPRAREILDRCEALSQEQLMSLHGAIREFRPVEGP
jgi:hypothetical protein